MHGRARVRAAVLVETGLLDAEERESMRSVAELAAWICQTPMAAVTLVEEHRQFFAGSVGLTVRETDRDSSFCAVAMQTPDHPMLVPDALADPRFADNPLVSGAPDVRSYAGVPLAGPHGVSLGAVCALGATTMDLSDGQVSALRALGTVTAELLDARRTATRLVAALEQVQASRAAEAVSREQFSAIFEHAPVGMTLAAADGTYLQVNPAFAALLGMTPAELVGRGTWEVTVPEDVRGDEEAAQKMVSEEQGVVLREKRYLRVDGISVPTLVTTSLVRPAGAARPVLLSQVESIEQRRAAEARLLEVQSAHDGIVSIDPQGRVTSWNLGAQRLFGHSAAVMLGQRLDRIIPANLLGAHHAGIERMAAGGAPALMAGTVEVPALRADGRQILVELALSRWSQGDRAGYTAVLRDVTARRRSELLTDLVRHAASTANQAQTFTQGAGKVLAEVCARLGWVAAHAWTADTTTVTWTVAAHAHHGPGRCRLVAHADAGSFPSRQPLPLETRTRYGSNRAELADGDIEDSLVACGIGSAVAVPVLAGGETVGTLEFYLPRGCDSPDADLTAALEQVGTLLGRVVERERAATLLRHQADHDPLTGLANRRKLLHQISALQRAGKDGQLRAGAALVLVDLDRFGVVNSSLGYPVGDLLLQEAAARLSRAAAPADLVARLGGDEFVVLIHQLPPTGQEGPDPAAAFAQVLLEALTGPVTLAGQRLTLGASIGVCTIGPQHTAAAHYPAALLRDADTALRHAKRRGKGRIEVFDAAMREDNAQRLADESDLATAIACGALILHYQPVMELQTGKVVGAEALVRWPRPGHGLVRPDLFIPLAEASGLIVELGRWVLQRACADAARWPHEIPALAGASVSVNVSARQLAHPRILDDVDDALRASGLPADRLVVEITESALIEDQAAVLEVLAALRRRGVRLALDDFGTGYSSLGYVQALPVDILKIDKSFVDLITGPDQGTALTEVVLKLAEATGLRTIAEGVETPQQVEALRQLGCHAGQGYIWSQPLPIDLLATKLGLRALRGSLEQTNTTGPPGQHTPSRR